MPIVKESLESAPSTFNLHKALFGDEIPAEVSPTTSTTTQDRDAEEQLKPQETLSLKSIEEEVLRSSNRRVSSIQRESLIVQSIRKISAGRFDSDSSVVDANPSIDCSPEILQKLEANRIETLATFNKCLETAHSKLFKLGSATVDSKGYPKTPATIESLLDQMARARAGLSKPRRKLMTTFRQLEHLKRRNLELDNQIKNVRLEELHDLQVEVSRTGEKIDETSKQMARARTQYESDISKAAHVREKWYTFQNKILTKMDDLAEVEGSIRECRVYLCGLLERKKRLREENLELRKRCRIIDNKPLLRRYDLVLEELEAILHYTEKFNEI